MSTGRADRWIVSFARQGRLCGVAKVGLKAMAVGVLDEWDVLSRLKSYSLPFDIPQPLHLHEGDDYSAAILTPVPLSTHLPRLKPSRVAEMLVSMEAACADTPVCHGDFAPWNVSVTPSAVVVLDWETAQFASKPMHDLVHYLVQEGRLLRLRGPRATVTELTARGRAGAVYLTLTGHQLEDAVDLVLDYLTQKLQEYPHDSFMSAMKDALS